MTDRRIVTLSAFLLLCFAAGSSLAQESAYALTNANLFDGVDDRIRRNVTVLVRGRSIVDIIDADAQIDDAYDILDMEGQYLMPGMIDVHTHLNTLDQASRALESGVTTIRTAGVAAFQDISMRELANSGAIPGPDVHAAGVFVTPNLSNTVLADPRLAELHTGVNTDAELRHLVSINADRGVDVIKTRGTDRAGLPDTDPRQQIYTEHQLRVIVEEAARHGIPVMAHAHGDEGARAAVLAGVRSIEHGTYLSDDTLRLMKDRGTWLVPTYVTMDELNEEQYNYVLRLRGKHMLPHLERAIRSAYEMGVRIATGADNYYDEKSINRISIEVEHFVRMGMSHFDALQTATVSAAELLGIGEHTGQIAPGYEADIILVPANPLEDVAGLQDVLMVMSNGQVALKRIPFAVVD